jgi:uncharacterized protein (DUF111 family)
MSVKTITIAPKVFYPLKKDNILSEDPVTIIAYQIDKRTGEMIGAIMEDLLVIQDDLFEALMFEFTTKKKGK